MRSPHWPAVCTPAPLCKIAARSLQDATCCGVSRGSCWACAPLLRLRGRFEVHEVRLWPAPRVRCGQRVLTRQHLETRCRRPSCRKTSLGVRSWGNEYKIIGRYRIVQMPKTPMLECCGRCRWAERGVAYTRLLFRRERAPEDHRWCASHLCVRDCVRARRCGALRPLVFIQLALKTTPAPCTCTTLREVFLVPVRTEKGDRTFAHGVGVVRIVSG